MNKYDYLNKLSRFLHMLQESEVKDILDEYEQHIDMKIAEGMTEEEAVSAFGTVEELAKEILDAYHVKADFKEKKKSEVLEKVQYESKKAVKNAGEAGRGFFGKCKELLRKASAGCINFIKGIMAVVKSILLTPFIFLKQLLSKRDSLTADREKTIKVKNERTIIGSINNFICGIVRLIKKVCYGFVFFCAGVTEIIMMLFVGVLIVLLILGYPVIGVTIVSLGLSITLGATAYYSGIRWRRG